MQKNGYQNNRHTTRSLYMKRIKLVIIGSGLAAFTAAIYAARANLQPIIYEGTSSESDLVTQLEDFPGFPKGITYSELNERVRKQALRFGAKVLTEDVVAVELQQRPFIVRGQENVLHTEALVIAKSHVLGTEQLQLQVVGTSKTNLEGVFIAVDIYNDMYRTPIVKAASGCTASIDAERWLSEKGHL
jgi:thioredoxin reductase